MAKIKAILISLFWTFCSLYSYSVPSDAHDCVIATASYYVGTMEKGGNNKGFDDSSFERSMRLVGWYPGAAWCSFAVKMFLNSCGVPNTITGFSPSSYNKKDVIYTDGEFKQTYKDKDVLIMSLSYEKFRNVKARYKAIGHTGVVLEIGSHSITTIEGNTNDLGTRDSRTGDGVFRKKRPLNKKIHITRWKKE